MTHVVVVVPGIMGSELSIGGEVVWPGSLMSLKLPYTRMGDLVREDLVVSGIWRSFGPVGVYSSLLDQLVGWGFEEHVARPTLYTYPYDWRKSNYLAARGLADFLDSVVDQHAGVATISLVAHSMGGLVSRSFLESGTYVGRPGFSAVRNLITIGTPHRGAALALTAAVGLEKRLFLNRSQVQQIANDPRYPSLYELLPPSDEPFAWLSDEDTLLRPANIFDPGIAKAIGLVSDNLEAAVAFRRSLDVSRRPPFVRYFSFYGSRQQTSASIRLSDVSGVLRPVSAEAEDAGDGTVPIWSGLINGLQSMPVGGEHGLLFKGAELRSVLGALLGIKGTLALAEGGAVEVVALERVVEPEWPLHVSVLFPGGVRAVEARLFFERMDVDEQGVARATLIGVPLEIRYSGGKADRIAIIVDAPALSGFYRVVFEDLSADLGRAYDEFTVQISADPS